MMVFTQKMQQLAAEQIALEFESRNETLGREYGQVISDYARRGTLHSSMAIRAVAALYEAEVRIRGERTWQILYRVVTSYGIEPGDSLAISLMDFISPIMKRAVAALTEKLLHSAPLKGSAGGRPLMQVGNDPLRAAAEQVARKLHGEIELFVVQLERATRGSESVGASGVTIFGTVGAVQTGSFAVANITQQIDATAREELRRALDAVEAAVAQNSAGAVPNAREITEIINESRAELEKPEPNRMKLGSMLLGVATTIQTVASAGPAYAMLRGALALIGIPLP